MFFINLECLQVGGDKGPPITEVSPTGVSSDLDGTGRGFIISVVYYSRAETWRRKAPLFHLRIDVMFWGTCGSRTQHISCAHETDSPQPRALLFLVAAGMLDAVPGPLVP